MKAEGVKQIMDLDFYPFGNAYYGTEKCGEGPYDSTERHCWADRCVVEDPPDDCFAGHVVPQHGAKEGRINTIEACAVTKSLHGSSEYWPFIECMEKAYDEDATMRCAHRSHLDGAAILACAAGPEGQAANEEMARATPDHPGVPYILVDGKEAEASTKGLLKAICGAYKGTPPKGCANIDEIEEEEKFTILMV